MNPILYILQKDFSAFRTKIDIPLLEILYHTFTCFDPELIYATKKKSLKSFSYQSKSRQLSVPTRHSRFLPHFEITSSTGVKKISFKLNNERTEEQPFKGQRKAPQRMTDYKKVVSL